MTIAELERRSGMTRANIRFYEGEGLISPARRENGYRDTGFRFRWNGQPAALYLRPCQSTEDITPVAQLLLRDLYGDLLTPVNARRMIQPEA